MPLPKVYRNRPIPARNEEPTEMTYDELYALAQERNLGGRSSMTKDQLIKALDL